MTTSIPEESAETTMARINASADLVLQECPHCDMQKEENATYPDGLPRAIGIRHEIGCPYWIAD